MKRAAGGLCALTLIALAVAALPAPSAAQPHCAPLVLYKVSHAVLELEFTGHVKGSDGSTGDATITGHAAMGPSQLPYSADNWVIFGPRLPGCELFWSSYLRLSPVPFTMKGSWFTPDEGGGTPDSGSCHDAQQRGWFVVQPVQNDQRAQPGKGLRLELFADPSGGVDSHILECDGTAGIGSSLLSLDDILNPINDPSGSMVANVPLPVAQLVHGIATWTIPISLSYTQPLRFESSPPEEIKASIRLTLKLTRVGECSVSCHPPGQAP
jgi:hypothetical protein